MEKVFKRAVSVLLVSIIMLGSAPLAGFVGLDLPDISEWFAPLFLPLKAKAASDAISISVSPKAIEYSFDSAGNLYINGYKDSSFEIYSEFENKSENKIYFYYTILIPDVGFSNPGEHIFTSVSSEHFNVDKNEAVGYSETFKISNPLALKESEITIKAYKIGSTLGDESALIGSVTVPISSSATKRVTAYFMNIDGTYTYKTTKSTDENGNVIGFTRVDDEHYARNMYTLTTIVDGIESSYMCYYGSQIDVLYGTPPSKDGYSLAYWVDDNGDSPPDNMPAHDLTLTAKWSNNAFEETYPAYFLGPGGEILYTYEVPLGSKIPMPPVPSMTGYVFEGWSPAVGTMDYEGMIFNSVWSVATYTIRIVVDGNTICSFNYAYGEEVDFYIPEIVKEGYIFCGFDKEIPETMPNCDLALTACFVPIIYTITFDANGGVFQNGDIRTDVSMDYGSEIYPPANPKKDGYVFLGWNPSVPSTMPAEDLTLYAIWTESTQPITYYGKLEKYVTTIVMNGSDVYVSEITVDGKTYDVDGDFIAEDDIKEHIGKDVVFSVKEDKVIWFDVVSNLKTSVSADIYSVGKLYYSGEKYDKENLTVTVSICNNLKEEKANAAGLKGLDELKAYVSTVTVKTSNDDLLSFDGKDEFEVSVNQYIPIGGSHEIELSLDVDSGYKIADTVEKEYVSITAEMTGTQNGKDINKSCFMNVTVENRNYSKPTNKKNQTSSSGTSSPISAQAQKAAQELSKISGAAAVAFTDPIMSKIFTNDQLDAIGDMLLCEVTLAAAPKDTFDEILSKNIIDKVFQCNTNLIGVTNDSVYVTVAINSEYGEIKVKFTCDFQEYILNGRGFGYFGSISYEVVGGKGRKKLPDNCITKGSAGGLTGFDMKAFCDAAYALVESELKESYSVGWGSEVNKAADIIFNKSVIKILSYTKHKTVSGLTWELITIPGKSVKIKCPVDVYVYNSNNELVASVENNQPTLENDLVEIIINGDEKEVILFDDSYYLVYEARAEGAMNITVTEYGSSEGALKTASIESVPLYVGTTYTQNIDMQYLEDSDYSLTADDESIYAITSEEFLLHDHQSDGEWFEGEASTCSEHGYSYTMCSVCNEWYCEYYDLLEHSDSNNDDYCDSCTLCLNTEGIKFSIITPNSRTINYGEPVKLNITAKNLPSGAKIKWSVVGEGVKLNPSSSGRSCKVTATSTGNVVIKAYVVDSNGKVVTDENGKQVSDSEYFYSKANLWLRIVYFFKKLFGISTNTVQLFKGVI